MTLWKEMKMISSSKKELREFGLTVGIVLALIGGWAAWKGREHAVYFLTAGGLLVALGLVFPRTLKPLQKPWMMMALVMGWVMSRVILTVLFYTVLTPIGLILRLTGKDLLDIKPGVSKDSYWRSHKQRDKKDHEKQF